MSTLPEVSDMSSACEAQAMPSTSKESSESPVSIPGLPVVPDLPTAETVRDLDFEEIMERQRKMEMKVKVFEEMNSLLSGQETPKLADMDFNDERSELLAHWKLAANSAQKTSAEAEYPTRYSVLNTDMSCHIFDHETLQMCKFFPGESLPPMLQELVDEKLFFRFFKNGTLRNCRLAPEDKKNLCEYIFFLMTVSSDMSILQACHFYLTKSHHFKPTYNDILTVLYNWGATEEVLYKNGCPVNYALPEALQGISPLSTRAVEINTMRKALEYIRRIFTFSLELEYAPLLEPMLRISFDSVFHKGNQTLIKQIVDNLLRLGIYEVQNFHLKDWDLTSQINVCIYFLKGTPLAIPLAYAIIQQWLGIEEESLLYKSDVNIYEILKLCFDKISHILSAPFSHKKYFVHLLISGAFQNNIQFNGEQSEEQKICIDKLYQILSRIRSAIHSNEYCVEANALRDTISRNILFLHSNVHHHTTRRDEE